MGPRFLPKPTTAAEDRGRLRQQRDMYDGLQLLHRAQTPSVTALLPAKAIAAARITEAALWDAGLGKHLITDCQQDGIPQDPPEPQHRPPDRGGPLEH